MGHKVVDALHLGTDLAGGLCSEFSRKTGCGKQLGIQADDLQRVLQIVDDGSRKLTDHRQTFRLHDLVHEDTIEVAQAMADELKQVHGQFRGTADEVKHGVALEEMHNRGLGGHGAGRAVVTFDHRHFTEDFPGTQTAEHPVPLAEHLAGDLNVPGLNQIESIPAVSLPEHRFTGLKMANYGKTG